MGRGGPRRRSGAAGVHLARPARSGGRSATRSSGSRRQGSSRDCPNLAAIFSLGAGVDHVVRQRRPARRADRAHRQRRPDPAHDGMGHAAGAPPSSPAARLRPVSRRSTAGRNCAQPAAAAVRVGIMGLGVLGRDAAEVLVAARLSRRRLEPPADRRFEASRHFRRRRASTAFLARTDILVCLLPLTPETRGILSTAAVREARPRRRARRRRS